MRVTRQAHPVPRPLPDTPRPHPKVYPLWDRGGEAYVPHKTGGESGEQKPLRADSMEELLRPGVSSTPDMPSPALRLGARARTSPAASSSLRGVGVPVPGSLSVSVPKEPRLGTVRFTAQETYGTRKEAGRRAGRRGGEEGREEANAPVVAPGGLGLPALALGRAAPGPQLPEAAEGR